VWTLRLESFLHPFTDTNISTWFPAYLGNSASLKDIQTAIIIYTHERYFFVRTYLNKDYNFESNIGRQWKKFRRRREEFVLQIQR